MKAEELDRKFDDSEDIIEYLNLSTIKKPGLEQKEINFSFPSAVFSFLLKLSYFFLVALLIKLLELSLKGRH